MRIVAGYVVQNARPTSPKESYPLSLRGLRDLLLPAQPDPPEPSLKGWDTSQDVIHGPERLLSGVGSESGHLGR